MLSPNVILIHLCPIIVVTFAYKFHALTLTTIMGQSNTLFFLTLFDLFFLSF